MKKGRGHKLRLWLMISFIILSTITPYIPTLPTIIANAASIIPPDSSVDENTLLTLNPPLDGKTYWYYDGLVNVVNQDSGNTLGKVRRYRASDGSMTRLMVSGELAGDKWVDVLAESPNQVFAELKDNYTYYWFQPPAPKQGFGQYKFSDLLDVAGYEYSTSGNTIYISNTSNPKVTKFNIVEPPSMNGCYPSNTTITIEFEVEEYMPTSNKVHNVQIFGWWEGADNPFLIYSKSDVTASGGRFSDTATVTLPKLPGTLKLFMRAYDGAYRVDQDSKAQNGTLPVAYPIAQKLVICTDLETPTDDGSIPMYDWTKNTLLRAEGLAKGPAGRQNGMMANHLGNLQWFGPIRFPTIYDGHVDDGATPIPKEQGINRDLENIDGRWGLHTAYAYPKPFYYILSPVDVDFAKPYGPVHPSEVTETFNVQLVSMFGEKDIEDMFNGNPEYVLDETPTYDIETVTGQALGTYYYIRDLAAYSGGEASNNCTDSNETCLEIYRTEYPDITSFTLRDTNDYTKPNTDIFMDFAGFEYVANDRFDNVRNWVDYSLEVIEGPSLVGSKLEGRIYTNKADSNPEKPLMNRYDGSYANNSDMKFTPTAEGKYVVQLTIKDAVFRYTSATLSFTIGENGGGDEEPGGKCDIDITINATSTLQSVPADMDTDPIGEINEDDSSASNIFDVMDYSIPTDEYLDVYGETKRYLMDYQFQKYEGTITYTIEVDRHYDLEWQTSYPCGTEENPATCWETHYDTDYKKLSFQDIYNYSFWQKKSSNQKDWMIS